MAPFIGTINRDPGLNSDGWLDFNVGDLVVLTAHLGDDWTTAYDFEGNPTLRRLVRNGSNGNGYFVPGEAYPITRITRNRLYIRIHSTYGGGEQTTVDIHRNGGAIVDRPTFTAPGADYVLPRALGVTPNRDVTMPDGSLVPVIAIDDPRIQWIWDDLGTYAQNQNWCDQYDRLAEGINIPGRPRKFNPSIKVGSVTLTGTFMARSLVEAENLLRADLVANGMALPALEEPIEERLESDEAILADWERELLGR